MIKKGKLFVILISIVFVLSLAANADIERKGGDYVEEITKSFDVNPGGTLDLEACHGSVHCMLSPDAKLHIYIKKSVDTSSKTNAKRLLDEYEIEIDQSGNDVKVEVDRLSRGSNNGVQLHFEVKVPKNYNVDCKTGGGSIKAEGLIGNLDANTGGGSVKVSRTEGNIGINTGGGSVKVSDVKKGKVKVNTGGGSVSVRDVANTVKVNTGGGSIDVSGIGGKAVVSTGGGTIDIGASEGSVHASTGGGSIDIDGSKGEVFASTGGGSVRVDGSNGPVKVSTGGGSIDVENARESIIASTGGGSIKAKYLGAKDGKGEVSLSTGGGDVTLYIPEDLGATFDVELKLRDPGEEYKIESDFPLKIDKDDDKITATGVINKGGNRIKIRTTNSDIKIKKL